MQSSDRKAITKVGWWLRKTRLDEVPQLWSVLVGDLSLIGPRPEIPRLAATYYETIDFYNARHIIKPGLSGWAQLKHNNPPKFAEDIEKTKTKLAYDLYYIKNRSFWLDIKVALWTLRILVSQSGK
jgi:lipopolysaccharide/colanic/teichoic acid biosynthesis glycosyltransferase